MSAKWKDRLGSVLLLAFVAILWMQRDYVTPFGGIFPDHIMICMVILLVLALILSFTPYATLKENGEVESTGPKNWTSMVVVAALLLLWTGLLRYLGFAITGVAGFAGISWYLGGCSLSFKSIGTSIGIALGITYLIIVIFGHLLLVPLPKGMLF
jgi:Tripartite tricarboxylate transporter TctB family